MIAIAVQRVRQARRSRAFAERVNRLLDEMTECRLEAERERDTRRLVEVLGDTVVDCRELPPTHEEDAAHLAVMVPTAKRDEFDEALRKLADDEWRDWATVRLLGPLAPYDFVQASENGN